MKKMIDVLGKMYWHDGIFLESKIAINKDMIINLTFELYKDSTSENRNKINIQFTNIENLVITTNTRALLENCNAGNINYAYVKASQSNKKYRFIVYLLDGVISFEFSNGEVLRP